MTPAPKKRTSWCHTALAASGVPCSQVSSGVTMPKPSTSPARIAMPTAKPTRWPAPISANCMLMSMPLPRRPTRNHFSISAATNWVAAST